MDFIWNWCMLRLSSLFVQVPSRNVGKRISASEEEGEAGEAGMLCSFYLEVGHVHSATFVISGSAINHVRGGVNAQ